MDGIIFIGIIVVTIVTLMILTRSRDKKNEWVSTAAFKVEKGRLKPYCSKEDFDRFMSFLQSYKGGYVRRKYGEIVYQGYLGSEKGELKGVFYRLIVPNPNLSIKDKEEFRKFLRSIGVIGVNDRPSYETRDSKLKNREKNEDDFQRKEVGNKGEQDVRSVLYDLDRQKYSVINGAVLKYGDKTKEFDHIVVGNTGLFILETKAFGMTEGRPCKAGLFIDKGDKWIIRKKGTNRDIISPTTQVLEEKEKIEQIISCPVIIHSVVVLSNTELFIKQNIDLPYDVIRIDKLKSYIEDYNDKLTENDKITVLHDLNNSRVN